MNRINELEIIIEAVKSEVESLGRYLKISTLYDMEEKVRNLARKLSELEAYLIEYKKLIK